MNNTYLLINFFIILIPFALSFEKKINFISNIFPLVVSILLSAGLFISWDIDAARRGDWSFNADYTNSYRIYGLPAEEILFFITVPYSVLFMFECINHYIKYKDYSKYKPVLLIFSIILLTTGVLCIGINYTSAVLIISGLIFLLIYFLDSKIFLNRSALATICISFIPFMIVNYILTSLPVVIYNPDAITGIRITTIPAEDFLYSLSLISMNLFIYVYVKTVHLKKLFQRIR